VFYLAWGTEIQELGKIEDIFLSAFMKKKLWEAQGTAWSQNGFPFFFLLSLFPSQQQRI